MSQSSEPRTHDYGPGKRGLGHDYTITQVHDGGQRLKASGWGPRMRPGDFILLDNQGRASRYRVVSYEPVMSVDDMWHAELEFTPRTVQEVSES